MIRRTVYFLLSISQIISISIQLFCAESNLDLLQSRIAALLRMRLVGGNDRSGFFSLRTDATARRPSSMAGRAARAADENPDERDNKDTTHAPDYNRPRCGVPIVAIVPVTLFCFVVPIQILKNGIIIRREIRVLYYLLKTQHTN